LEFDVASIKSSAGPAALIAAVQAPRWTIIASGIELQAASMDALIRIAFKLQPYQLCGRDWMAGTRFDISAKLPDGAAKDEIPEMMRALLGERFHLAVHGESKERNVYALAVANPGVKLTEASAGPGASAPPFPHGRGGRIPLRVVNTGDSFQTYPALNGRTLFEAARITMPEIAPVLKALCGHDGTDGGYELSLEVPGGSAMCGRQDRDQPTNADPRTPADAASDPSGASIFASIQKLGLKRKSARRRWSIQSLTTWIGFQPRTETP
jgi:uncharacterized protein (TIGR03435 family)